jgi:hypothetical protein
MRTKYTVHQLRASNCRTIWSVDVSEIFPARSWDVLACGIYADMAFIHTLLVVTTESKPQISLRLSNSALLQLESCSMAAEY